MAQAQESGSSARVASIDVFRGLTILVMVFVNDVAGVKDVPWWMKHMPSKADGMTFVDLVFPAFLFIVGMSIPFAFHARLQRGASVPRLIGHVFVRTLGLLVVGVFMVNIDRADWARTGMSRNLWTLLMFLSVILVWNQYPKTPMPRGLLWQLPRLLGIGTLWYLASIVKGEQPGQILGLRLSWYGILGIIGWSYLAASLTYLVFRNQLAAMTGMIGFLVAVYIGDQGGAFKGAGAISSYVGIGSMFGIHPSITVAGMAVGLLFFPNSPAQTPGARVRWMLACAALLAAAGFCLRPVYHISKDFGTPPWSLISSALCCVLYALLYLVVDVAGFRAWAIVARPAGENPLLAYILPSIVYSVLGLLGITVLHDWFGSGGVGIARSMVFAFAIVGLTALLARLRVRLRL